MRRTKRAIAIVKEEPGRPREQFVFVYRPDQQREVMRAAGRWAGNPGLDFDWSDAATVRAQALRGTPEKLPPPPSAGH